MIRTRRLFLFALVLCMALAACACQRRANVRSDAPRANAPAATLDTRLSVAVAPFSGARDQRELLAGTLPPDGVIPGPDTLSSLDAALQTALHARPGRTVRAANIVSSCVRFVHRGLVPSREEHLRYWQQVGQCADSDLLLVPVVMHWRDRSGAPGGTSQPAWVILDLYLVDVKTGALLNHSHYDYQQRALTDNLLDVGSFVRRRGQWVSAGDLAREGIERGIRELGL